MAETVHVTRIIAQCPGWHIWKDFTDDFVADVEPPFLLMLFTESIRFLFEGLKAKDPRTDLYYWHCVKTTIELPDDEAIGDCEH